MDVAWICFQLLEVKIPKQDINWHLNKKLLDEGEHDIMNNHKNYNFPRLWLVLKSIIFH